MILIVLLMKLLKLEKYRSFFFFFFFFLFLFYSFSFFSFLLPLSRRRYTLNQGEEMYVRFFVPEEYYCRPIIVIPRPFYGTVTSSFSTLVAYPSWSTITGWRKVFFFYFFVIFLRKIWFCFFLDFFGFFFFFFF